MKKLLKKIYLLISILILLCLFLMQVVLASSSVPFEYNILPEDTNQSIIDTKKQKKLTFKLYDSVDTIYYNDKEVKIQNNSFQIDCSKFSGKTTVTFKNKDNQSTSFTYYFSDKKGKVDDYELVEGKSLSTYISTYKNVKIIYTTQEKTAAKRMISYLKKVPQNILQNVDIITMIPYENNSNIAGVTKENSITLYRFSQYSATTQKNIIYHEIAHTWATYLMQKKVIDYSYTDYSTFVKADNNFVSNYSKEYIEEKGKYNEDFADSLSFYFMNQGSFKKKYPQRFVYINSLLKLKIEEKTEEEK